MILPNFVPRCAIGRNSRNNNHDPVSAQQLADQIPSPNVYVSILLAVSKTRGKWRVCPKYVSARRRPNSVPFFTEYSRSSSCPNFLAHSPAREIENVISILLT